MSMRPPTLPGAGDPPRKKKSRRGGCIGLLLLLAGLLCVSVFVSGQRQSRQPAPARPTPTATAAATATTMPTEPAIAMPTNTPTSAPTATVDNSLVLYATELASPIDELSAALRNLGTLMASPRLGSGNWKLDVIAQMAVIQVSHRALTEITPPPVAATFHQHLIEATSKCSESTRKMAAGLDAMDADLMEEAAALMRACTDGLETAVVEIEALAY